MLGDARAPRLRVQAASDCDASLVLDPHYAKAFYRRACARSGLGDAAGALADAEQALLLTPDSQEVADLHNRLGNPRTTSDKSKTQQDLNDQKSKAAIQDQELLAVRSIPGEGEALVAMQHIPAGQEVIAESPFAALPEKSLHEKASLRLITSVIAIVDVRGMSMPLSCQACTE